MISRRHSLSIWARRLWVRGLTAVGGKNARWSTLVYGYRADLLLGEQIQKTMAQGLYEPEESAWVEALLKPGMTFVDVGANFGHYMLLAARFVGPTGKVIAFEPSPVCGKHLESVVLRNDIRQVKVEHAALGDQAGQLDLILEDPGLHSPSFLATAGATRFSVPVMTLDDYFAENPLGSIDVLKLDVEGYEPNVIRGASQLLRQGRISFILCELNDIWLEKNGTSALAVDQLIVSAGFSRVRTKRYDYHENVLYACTAKR